MFSFLEFNRMWYQPQEVTKFPPSMTVVSKNFKIFSGDLKNPHGRLEDA